jgi:pimeloyl-ACP methyl ester carboxylesterase
MQPLFEHRLTLGGFGTRVLELEGDGPPLVLLHDYADSADTWRHLLARLGRVDRRALAVDLPGFGSASRLGPGVILPQLEAFAGDLVRHVARDGQDPIVVGDSVGGCIALLLAQAPELPLAGAVAMTPAGLASPGRLSVARDHASGRPTRAALSAFLSTGRRLLPELQDPFVLAEVCHPVLLLWRGRDPMVAADGGKLLLEALPTARVEVLEDCGHRPQLEMPDRLLELIGEFELALPRAA